MSFTSQRDVRAGTAKVRHDPVHSGAVAAKQHNRLRGLIGLLCLAWPWFGGVARAADFVWIEGEAPAAIPAGMTVAGVERSHFLSGGNWLFCGGDPGEVPKKIPEAGLTVAYPFEVAHAGRQELWARIGFEFARAPFEWRLDGGTWKTVTPDDLTTDLMELGLWNEVGWLKLADPDLAPGKHKLEIHLGRTKEKNGSWRRTLFGLDAICVSAGPFVPNGPHKPTDSWRTERDDQAAANVFQLPEPKTHADRANVRLAGLWEICRDDEQLPGEVAAPIRDLPKQPRWRAIVVPGDKNAVPDLVFAHRVWYRTKVNVPAASAGRSFFLVFPANSLNTTVYVNGILCGFDKNPFARVQIDVSRAVKPGVNEVWVGIRDNWYAREADPQDPLKLRRTFNLPLRFFSQGWQRLVYPVWNQPQAGILGTPQLVCAGPAYVADTFCIPSVARKSLGLEVTVENPGDKALSAELLCEAVNDKTGQIEWTAPAQKVAVEARGRQLLAFAAPWPTAKLWWPDEPNLYRLRTTVRRDNQPVDVGETLFGFREWTTDGIRLKLNGVNWQGFSEHGIPGGTLEEWAASLKSPKYNYGFGRIWPQHGGKFHFFGKEPDEALEYLDRQGALVRRTGYLDGEAIGYLPEILPQLGPNWIDHLTAWIKGERNHPCIMIWSVENELTFINARNVGQLGVWEPIATRAWEAVRKVDPTRPMMIDGGGATRAQTLPIHGDHYSTKAFWNYPELAYEANAQSPCGTWTWDEQRPRFIGEELFAAGLNTAYAYFGGEDVFQGKVKSRAAVGKAMQIISQGYRWYGVAACDFCQQPSDADGSQYNGWAPRAVLVRQWDWTFASGRKAKRTFGIFNGTRFSDPISFTWTLTLNGREVGRQTTIHNIAAGENEKFERELPIPTASTRQEGELMLTLSVKGAEVFRDVKAVSLLPEPPAIGGLSASNLFVYDPQGGASDWLKSRGVAFTPLDALAPPSVPGQVWLVGRDALKPEESTTSALAAYAAGGGRVVLFEQANPLRFQGLNPAEAESTTELGRIAFADDSVHPILAGLKDKDFFTWEPGEIVYRNVYRKPSRGAKSILQCGESLANSALLVTPVGPGLVILCQAAATEKLTDNPTAATLAANLLNYAASYKLEQVAVSAAVDGALTKVLDAINLRYSAAASPLDALTQGRLAIVSATPANLQALAAARDKVGIFTQGGGYLVLHGLSPDGLADYNKLVGFEHMIRPFRQERVSLTAPRHPLLNGVTLSDVVLYSAKRIFSWQSGNYVANDTFSYVVDLEDVAPFGKWDSDFHYNLVNGMTSPDGWPYICNEPATVNQYVLTLPKPQEVVSWTWDGNTFYDLTSQVDLIADGDEASKLTFDVPENGEPVTLDVRPPKTGTVFTFRHAKTTDLPDKKQNGKKILGCDNIALVAKRPADFRQRVRPMLNNGALVEYPQGRGGIVLCNLLLKDSEEVPANAIRKRTILATLLRNLKAPFAGKTVIAGAGLVYQPIDLSKQVNQYRTERGWFGNPKFTFRDLPTGDQLFAGVKFHVFEFTTSPVPTAIMLGGRGVPNNPPERVTGIPVNRKADALFFLHTARVDQPRNDAERRANKPVEVAKYVVHYADGQVEEVPLLLEVDIDSYRRRQAHPLPGAQIGWTRPYEGTDESAVAYVKQWNNPRPDTVIASIDLVYGKDRRGVPVLLALTAATAPPPPKAQR
jgi:beta-galactosidase